MVLYRHSIMTLQRCLAALTATILTLSSGWRSHAQAPAAATPTCMTLLTDAEVNKALGAIPAKEKKTLDPGNTSCSWARQSPLTGITTLSMGFVGLAGIKGFDKYTVESWGETWPATLPRFYDRSLKVQTDIAQTRGEALPGIGQRATLFAGGAMTTIVIQRPDGIATIVGVNVSRKEALALAQAIVTP